MERRKLTGIFPLIFIWAAVDNACAVLKAEVAGPVSGTFSISNGKKQMDELIRHSQMPVGSGPSGNCWKSALDDLEIGCRFLTEEVQSRMALRFTSCFNEMFGAPLYLCEKQTSIQSCLQKLTPEDRTTFKDYFLHTQDMCYYLRQEVWQEQTNDAVTRLTDAASDVTSQMIEQKVIQEQIYITQKETFKVQSDMKKHNDELFNAVVRVNDVVHDFSVSTREHQIMTSEIFDKLGRMQKLVSWIQGEMSLFDAVFFYLMAIILGFFATATARTKSARFFLVLLVMLSMWCESALVKYFSVGDHGLDLHPEDVQYYVWAIRKVVATVGFLSIVIAGALYRDPLDIQKQMLDKINCSFHQLSQFIKEDLPKRVASENEDGGSSSDDTFDNYSSDESEDNLEHELKSLKEDAEDNDAENVDPLPVSSPSMFSRYFGKEPNEVTSTSPNITGMRNHRYNLRERSATPSENPVLREESVTQFAKAVKRRRTPKPKSDPDPSSVPRYNYFSSDDEQ